MDQFEAPVIQVQKEYRGFRSMEFESGGRQCTVVYPRRAGKERRWVWRAEFLGAFDQVDLRLLEMGWHVAYCRLSDMFGCPQAVEEMKRFHDMLVEWLGLNPRADLFGFSRGGLYACNYTMKYPQDVGVLYLDAPVLDLKSWPFGAGKGCGSEKDKELCREWWDIRPGSLSEFHQSPVDRLDDLLAAGRPILLIAGDADEVVPYEENGALLAKKMEEQGHPRKVILKLGAGHHPHSLEDPAPAAGFIAENGPAAQMERYAWTATVREGRLEEYTRRHREIWPEMVEVLKEAGIRNYTIWNTGHTLFGYYECEKGADYAAKIQAESPVVDRWNEFMKDVMVMEMDPETGAQPKMKQVFFLE